MKKILLLLILLPLSLWAEIQKNENFQKEFSTMKVALEVGEIYPFFDLSDAIDNSVYVQGEFQYHYFKYFDGYLQFGYSYMNVIEKLADFPGVHQFNGRVGLLWNMPWVSVLRLGGGFSCIWARSDGGDPTAARGGMLSDNESEFGLHARLNLPVFRFSKWNLGFNAYWEQIWTKPDRSNMLWFGIYLERRIR